MSPFPLLGQTHQLTMDSVHYGYTGCPEGYAASGLHDVGYPPKVCLDIVNDYSTKTLNHDYA